MDSLPHNQNYTFNLTASADDCLCELQSFGDVGWRDVCLLFLPRVTQKAKNKFVKAEIVKFHVGKSLISCYQTTLHHRTEACMDLTKDEGLKLIINELPARFLQCSDTKWFPHFQVMISGKRHWWWVFLKNVGPSSLLGVPLLDNTSTATSMNSGLCIISLHMMCNNHGSDTPLEYSFQA